MSDATTLRNPLSDESLSLIDDYGNSAWFSCPEIFVTPRLDPH
jgi:hypothetical protein